MNKSNRRCALFWILIFTSGFFSCKKEPGVQAPQASLNIETDTVHLKVGSSANIPITIRSSNGVRSIVVYKSGGFLKEISLEPNTTSYNYETGVLPETTGEGEEFHYSFLVVDGNGTDSERKDIILTAELYDKITIGNTQLYNITIPEEGMVPVGDSIKLAKGRSYFLSASLNFEAGSDFIAEEGTHLYMDAEAEDPIQLLTDGQVDIAGTSVRPVVFTSSKLLTGAEPEAGDWNSFRIGGSGSGSNSGTIDYLRLEYGGDRTLRLANVGEATVISHVQVFKAAGEGIMITDGNAGLKYIVATDCAGGSYRMGDAYEGKMQFIISTSSEYYDELDDFAIRESAKPIICNATLLGPGTDTDDTHGLRIRGSSAPKIYNCILAQFPRRGVRVVEDVEIKDLLGPAVFAYSYVFDVPDQPYRDDGELFAGTFNDEGKLLENTFHNNVLTFDGDDFEVALIAGIGVSDFLPEAEQTSAFDPSTIHSFFSAAPFAGAVKNEAGDWTRGWVKNEAGDWTRGWVKNADGTIR